MTGPSVTLYINFPFTLIAPLERPPIMTMTRGSVQSRSVSLGLDIWAAAFVRAQSLIYKDAHGRELHPSLWSSKTW